MFCPFGACQKLSCAFATVGPRAQKDRMAHPSLPNSPHSFLMGARETRLRHWLVRVSSCTPSAKYFGHLQLRRKLSAYNLA